jgi:hypothetical protein
MILLYCIKSGNWHAATNVVMLLIHENQCGYCSCSWHVTFNSHSRTYCAQHGCTVYTAQLSMTKGASLGYPRMREIYSGLQIVVLPAIGFLKILFFFSGNNKIIFPGKKKKANIFLFCVLKCSCEI